MTAPAVIGVDPSTKACGIALPTGRTILYKPPRDVGHRCHDAAATLARLIVLYRPALIAVEGYALNGYPLSMVRLGEFGGALRLAAWEHAVPVLEIPPTTLKRWATGNGNAPKDRMLDAAALLGTPQPGHDQADAALLRLFAVHGLTGADPFPTGDGLDARLDALTAIAWPTIR